MSKENNLKDFLADLYMGISSRKPGASKNPQDFRKEIESIPAGGSSEGGSAECSGNHIIEVDELPTENIDETALYKCSDSYYQYAKELKDVIVADTDGAVSFVAEYTNYGFTIEPYYVKTKPTENIRAVDGANLILPLYYVENEGDIFFYGDLAGSGTNEWISFSIFADGMTNGGAISDISEATTVGYYYALVSERKEYLVPKGSVTITENNSTIDVTKVRSVKIEIEYYGLGVEYS